MVDPKRPSSPSSLYIFLLNVLFLLSSMIYLDKVDWQYLSAVSHNIRSSSGNSCSAWRKSLLLGIELENLI